MSSNGFLLNKELPAYFGFFSALDPQENPITTLVTAKGVRLVNQQEYGLTYHTIANASSANNKPDNASVTMGSTGFTNGSNTVGIWFEGGGQSWARKGAQELGRVLDYNGANNMSVEPDAKPRAMAEALGRIKSELEYISREGVYNVPNAGTTSGTTGSWVQRGYRNGAGLYTGTASGGVIASGTLGTFGTLNFDSVMDTLQGIWDAGNWRSGDQMIALCNSTVKRQLTEMFISQFNFGKNGALVTESGVNLLRFITDFGPIDILLTHNIGGNDLYFLNMDKMHFVARPVPGKPDGGFLFEQDLPMTTAGEMSGIYAEIGIDYSSGSFHGRMPGIGSTVLGGQAIT